jgi:hypothetical protein
MSRTFRIALIATLGASLLATVGTFLLLSRDAGPSVLSLSLLVEQRCDSISDIPCARAALNEAVTDTSKVAELLLAVDGMLQKDPSAFGGCHNANHIIGTTVARLVSEGQPVPQLTTEWYSCSEGLAHGYLEHVDLGSEPLAASTNAIAACAAVGATQEDLNLCPHGIGHSLYLSLGEDVDAAASACTLTFSFDIAQQVCARGVYMSVADRLFYADKVPQSMPTLENWRDALPNCSKAGMYAFICPSMFSRLAATRTVPEVASFLQWCDLVPKGKAECLNTLGTHIGAGLATNSFSSASVPAICELYIDSPTGRNKCWEQILLGLFAEGRGADALRVTCIAAGEDYKTSCLEEIAEFAENRLNAPSASNSNGPGLEQTRNNSNGPASPPAQTSTPSTTTR